MSGNTIQLGDLASGAVEETAEAAAEEAADDDSTGEFLIRAMEMMDSKGLLEPLLFGPEQASNIQQASPDPESGDGDDGGEQIDATVIADVGKQVIDTVGDVPISEVVKMAENNPEQVDMLIQEHL